MRKLNITLIIIMTVTVLICISYVVVIIWIPENELYYREPLPANVSPMERAYYNMGAIGNTMYPHTWFLTFTQVAGTSLTFFILAFILFKVINIPHEQNSVPSSERS